MKTLCIIPARGGSKRIPRKNIKAFMGKPIISYSIQTAIRTNLFDEIMVSTDDIEIKNISEDIGASIPFMRSKNTSDDFSSTIDVVLEVLNKYKEQGKCFEYCCCLYPTTPLLKAKTINKAYNALRENKKDCVFPIVPYGSPIDRALIIKDKKVHLLNEDAMFKRTQDLKTTYYDAGQFYFFKCKEIFDKKKLWTENTGFVILSEWEVQDIDNQLDWEMCEIKYEMMKKNNMLD